MKVILKEINSKKKKCNLCHDLATTKICCTGNGKLYLCDKCMRNTWREWSKEILDEE